MKKILCTASIFSSFFSYSQTQLTPEILFYKFDRSDNKIVNYASNPPSGTDTAFIMGALTQGNSTTCAGALVGTGLPSNTDYVNTNWLTNLSGDFTISFRTKNINDISGLFYLFGDVGFSSFRLFTNGIAGPQNWILRGPYTDLNINGAAVAAPTMTTITYNSTTKDLIAYVNGVYNNSIINTQSVPAPSITNFMVSGYSSNNGLPSSGLLEEFRIYSRTLSSSEVLELYNGPTLNILDSIDYLCNSTLPVTIKPSIDMDKYLWNTGEISDSINVNTAGTYKLNGILNCVSYVDSIVIQPRYSYGSNLDVELCTFNFPYTSPFGDVYNSPGTYTIISTNSVGCDSITTLNLTSNSITFDTLITRTGSSLEIFSATGGLDSYQWYDCMTNTPITGETNANFTATGNGSYAVMLEKNFCTFMTECLDVYTLSNENYSSLNLTIYPNPSNGAFNINVPTYFKNELEVNVYSMTGQKIFTKNFSEKSVLNLDFEAESGLYFLELKDSNGHIARKQIIKR